VKVAAAPVVSRKKSFQRMGSSALSFTGTNNNINGVPVIKKSIINVLETTSNNSSQMGGAASLNQT